MAAWEAETPAGFEFTVKASRYLTHVKRLTTVADGIARLHERIEPLVEASKLAVILWQLPANFQRDDTRLANALEGLPPGRHAFEFRHPSWFQQPVYRLLRDHQAALVIGDHPRWPFQTRELTADWTLIRLHYGRRGLNGNYSASELTAWRRRIGQWRRRAEVFAYLNNDWKSYAPANALVLRDGPGASIPRVGADGRGRSR